MSKRWAPWSRGMAPGVMSAVVLASLAVAGTAGSDRAGASAGPAAACPTPVSGRWTGTTIENSESTPGFWTATFRFSRGSGSSWRVAGSINLTGKYVGITKGNVVGAVHCAAVNLGAGGYTFSGTIAPNGKGVSGTWLGPGDTGTWTGAYNPAPTIVVTPSTDLVDGQSVSVRGTNFAKAAPIAVYECPASARLGSDCDESVPPAHVTASAAGAFSVVRHLSQIIVTPNGAVNCVMTQCMLRAENALLASDAASASISLAKANVACTARLTCQASLTEGASTHAPGQTVAVVGVPTAPTGSLLLDTSLGVMPCPHLPATIAPIADLIDTGFAPTTTLTVTETLHLANATDPEQVCFHSSVPFKSQSNPKVARAGTALLLDCSAVASKAPCVQARTQVGLDITVKFVVPGGDPRFYIVCPHGRQVWLSHYGTAHLGKKYAAQLQSSGGRSPIHWKVSSGKLPSGCNLNTKTGAITGAPTRKGRYSAVVRATDSEDPPQTASINVPITVT